jgi:hypothetical protein
MSDPKRAKGESAPPDAERPPMPPERGHRVYLRVPPDPTDEEIEALADRMLKALFGPEPKDLH